MAVGSDALDHSEDFDDEGNSPSYSKAVGLCLRRARKDLHLSLQAVEAMSSQEFKASVLGAYERGERSISVPRLQRLATLYGIPVDLLLPKPGHGETDDDSSTRRFDLESELDMADVPEREILRRFIATIRAQRRNEGTGARSIRSEDVRSIELLLGSAGTNQGTP
ncbi:MAG: helix-turn-helix domain-containing protein [Acidimicrobiales bacterium]